MGRRYARALFQELVGLGDAASLNDFRLNAIIHAERFQNLNGRRAIRRGCGTGDGEPFESP